MLCRLPDRDRRQERETGMVGKQVLATRHEHRPIGQPHHGLPLGTLRLRRAR